MIEREKEKEFSFSFLFSRCKGYNIAQPSEREKKKDCLEGAILLLGDLFMF